MSLVASYTDSEDEEDFRPNSDNPELPEDLSNSKSTLQQSQPSQVQTPFTKRPKNSLNLFGASQEQSDNSGDTDDSDSESDDEDDTATEGRKKSKPAGQPLDNPFRFFGSGNVSAQDSVLRVEFREQEALKTAVLERHVKMSETASTVLMINGKKICWNHRKGKCRFGHNCKFAHDSDILTNPDGTPNHPEKDYSPMPSADEPVKAVNVPYIRKVPAIVRVNEEPVGDDLPATPVFFASSAHLSGESGNSGKRKKLEDFSDEEGDDSKKAGKDRKKKRPGLTPGLVPGKKAMNMYYKNKDP